MLKKCTNLNSKKGITLIALVITIVILLILAGISINLTLGENGIISKASSARENSIKSSEQEAIDLAVASCSVDNNNGIITSEKLQEELNKTNSDVTVTGIETLTITFNKTGHSYEYKNKVDPDNNPHSVYAKLYTDGTVILSSTDEIDSTRTLDTDYGDLNNPTEEGEYISYYDDTYLPAMWVKYENYSITNSASNIIIKDQIYPSSTAFWYYDMENESFDTSNINFLYTKNAKYMFARCENLTNIPEGLFNNCSNVTSFGWTFASCTSINSIPAGLFDNCSNATNFEGTFFYCSSLRGNAPELWKRGTNSEENDYQGDPKGGGCFCNCTNLSNYELIPWYWTSNPFAHTN